MAILFSNPRTRAEIPEYPLGGSKRGLCVFEVRFTKGRGYKFYRTTTGKPKSDIAYGGKGCIVDGSDGKTYLLQFAGIYDFITIYRSDMKCADPAAMGFDHSVWPKDGELYKTLSDLIAGG